MDNEIKSIREFRTDEIPLPSNPLPFCSSSRMSLEIGAGAGLHAVSFAKNNPDFHHIAIERTTEKFNKMNGRASSHQLNNLSVFQDDAINWVAHNCNNVVFEKIFILYPNPYPKNHSARWIRMPFFKKLLECMDENSEIIFATNESFYINEVDLYAENHWGLKSASKKRINKDLLPEDYHPLTHFEKKYLERGQDCYHYTYKLGINL